MLPFKLGEFLRAHEVATLHGRYAYGIISIWIDRVFDAAFLMIVLLTIIAVRGHAPAIDQLLLITTRGRHSG